MASSSPWHSLYKQKRWFRLRWHQLQAEPLCRLCNALGTVKAADTVDHIKPHKGDPVLFHDAANLQSLCKQCHDGAKQRQERTGILPGHDRSGIPVDPNHPWNQA